MTLLSEPLLMRNHQGYLCLLAPLACSVADAADAADAGDEHGRLLWPQGQWQVPAELPTLGTKLLLQPGHCDPTVNLYESILAFRKNQVVGVWPVARGPGL
jgi:D-serine deaminase-like pyridoxal phosphate-dependent protein